MFLEHMIPGETTTILPRNMVGGIMYQIESWDEKHAQFIGHIVVRCGGRMMSLTNIAGIYWHAFNRNLNSGACQLRILPKGARIALVQD